MVHLETEAAGAEAEVIETAPESEAGSVAEAANETDEQGFYEEGDPFEGELEADEADAGDEADEAPPIDAPVSLNAEEKTKFAQLPTEAQRALSDILTRRDRETQQGLESARSAQRDAERAAADQIAQVQRDFAERTARVIQTFAPQPPPLELARSDPAEYTYRKGLYEQELAEYQQLMGQLGNVRGQADEHFETRTKEWAQEQLKQLMTIPEFADESTRPELIQNLQTVGVELGYPAESLRNADAQDFFALNKARQWKAKADKWDAHQKKRNERPRAASGRFSAAPAGARTPGQPGQTDVLKALYPND